MTTNIEQKHNGILDKLIFPAQILSMSLIWLVVLGITYWLLHLLALSIELKDVIGASVGISLVAIPVFWTLASVLTFVFWGLQKFKDEASDEEQ